MEKTFVDLQPTCYPEQTKVIVDINILCKRKIQVSVDEHIILFVLLYVLGHGKLTYTSKPGVYLPGYVAQDRREGPAVGLRHVALCPHRRVRFVWSE